MRSRRRHPIAFALGAVTLAVALAVATSSPAAAATVHPELWPVGASPLPVDAELEAAVDALVDAMSLEEKVGQVIQASITHVTPQDVRDYHLGSVLNGGGGWPGDVREATPADWLALADAFYDASMDTSDGAAAIPVIWGTDAVHGHNNIVGATLFPHNVGLGAARDPHLVRRIGEVTAVEMSVTGIDWNFSPTVAVARDGRWGRSYESYSEDPEVVRMLGRAMIEGLQGAPGTAGFLGPSRVVATAKHFLGDGGTDRGIDQGDNRASEGELIEVHLPPYRSAVAEGVQAVMASFNSWHGHKLHGHAPLLTTVLRQRMGFDGIVVGDWNGHGQLPGCSNDSCPDAFNAGVDLFMVPEDWKGLYRNTLAQARDGVIAAERLDEAVRRILRVKMRAGLFTAGRPSERPLGGDFERLGSPEHRAVARRAVRGSLVLLKNDGGALPIAPGSHVLVAGDGAHDIGKQSGGWTLSWQGTGNSNRDFPGATSIWEGLRDAVEAAGGRATLAPDGRWEGAGDGSRPDVAVVVYGEDPYAEFQGDRGSVFYDGAGDLALLRSLREAGVPVVSVFLSGRPLWVNPHLNASHAFVAAWLPGTEGAGVADVLVAAADGSVAHDFTGRLPFSWPRSPSQAVLNAGQDDYDPLFPLGYGLSYAGRRPLAELETDVEGASPSTGYVYFDARRQAGAVSPWEWVRPEPGAGPEIGTFGDVASGPPVFDWSETGSGEVVLRGDQVLDLTREANGNLTLGIGLQVVEPPTGPVHLGIGCGEGCGGTLDVSPLLAALPRGEWAEIRVRLLCFEAVGADLSRVEAPLRLSAQGPAVLAVASVQLLPPSGPPECP